MKKIILALFILALASNAFAANTKITELDADTAPTNDDLVVTVDNPGGTPANKKATIGNLTKGLTLANFPASANVVSLLSAANYAAIKALLDLEIGTDVQAYDADLAAIAALSVAQGKFIVGSASRPGR